MADELIHFLLIYDRSQDKVLEERPFTDGDEALEAYTDVENQYSDQPNIVVVLLGSDSIETIRYTHANYYGGFGEMKRFFGDLMA